MKLESIEIEIGNIIIDYNNNSHSPVEVLTLGKKLSGYLYFLSRFVSDAKKLHSGLYFIRKIEMERKKQALINKDLAVNKAEIKAFLQSSKNWKRELEAESDAYRCKLLLDQGNKVIEMMRSELSLMKKEYESIT